MTQLELANRLLPSVEHDITYYETKYPKRELKEGTIVTRFAPSPTGFVHMGSLYATLIGKKMASQTDGTFYLRIEDTDQKRTVENGIDNTIRDLQKFGINFDEGYLNGKEIGKYGPYIQSERKEIYEAFVKHLLEQNLAYPCFCTETELQEIREIQEQRKERIGYYGRWAHCRHLTMEQVEEKLNNQAPYIIRFRSSGDFNRKVKMKDLIKGDIEFPENDLDIVILKSDGLPTYHFAHLVDDYLMYTTHVIRGDEWLSSLPIHIDLFRTCGLKAPKYAHLAPIMKNDEGTVRKLSKRKDMEAAISYYHELGVPNEAIILYLLTVANANFEDWLQNDYTKNINEFSLDLKKMSSSGALFDLEKLFHISRNYIAQLTAEDLYQRLLSYTKEFDEPFYQLITLYKEDMILILNIEREQKKPRKDFAMLNEIKDQTWYMFDELFDNDHSYEWQTITNQTEIITILSTYFDQYYDTADDHEQWFMKIKQMATELGYASEVKEYKKNPDQYKGHVGDLSMVIRVAMTKKSQTPDLYEVLKILGIEKIANRINDVKEASS